VEFAGGGVNFPGEAGLAGGWRSGVRKVAWYYGMLESEGRNLRFGIGIKYPAGIRVAVLEGSLVEDRDTNR